MRLRSCPCAVRYRGATTSNSSRRLARLIIASLPSSSLCIDDSGGWYDSLMRQRFCQSKIFCEAIRSLAAILTTVVPFLADWNDSHLFSPQWSPHARFHGAVSLGMTTILSSVALWLLWRRSPDQDAPVTVAAAIPMAYWGPFFLAPFVPGTAVEDPGHRLVRIVGVPSNLLGAGATIITAGLGWYLDRRLRTAAPAH